MLVIITEYQNDYCNDNANSIDNHSHLGDLSQYCIVSY